MPGINDDPRQVEEIVTRASDAGATSISGIALHLRGEVRGLYFDWLRSHRPDLVPRYERLYGRGAYARPGERRRLDDLVRRHAPAAAASQRRPTPAETEPERPSTSAEAEAGPRRRPHRPSASERGHRGDHDLRLFS